jgi:hypothetical protein
MASDRTVTAISDISYRDSTTEKAAFVIRTTTVGDYLQRVGIYDPITRTCRTIDEVRSEFQRKAIAINRNPIKRKMFRDLLCGATVPPVVLADSTDQQPFTIIDGLQRSHVQQLALITLMSRENNKIEASGKESEFIATDIETIEKSGRKVISLDEFLAQPITYQLWRDLTHDEMVRLFMVLNVGQQKIAPRHLLEIMCPPLKKMFEGWGIKVVSLVDEQTNKEKEQAKDGKQKRVKVYEDGSYRFENLIDGLIGYISTDPQIKTVRLVQGKTDDIIPDLDNAIHVLGTPECKSDFLWVLNDLHDITKDAYKGHRFWPSSIVANTTRFVPLMAALGKARKNSKNSEAMEGRKLDLIRHCKQTSHDPLCFLSQSGSNSFESILDRIKSNIARRERAIFYNAWCQYFRIGLEDDKCPIDWSHGASHVGLEDAAD